LSDNLAHSISIGDFDNYTLVTVALANRVAARPAQDSALFLRLAVMVVLQGEDAAA
jgi:hypothetical protein